MAAIHQCSNILATTNPLNVSPPSVTGVLGAVQELKAKRARDTQNINHPSAAGYVSRRCQQRIEFPI